MMRIERLLSRNQVRRSAPNGNAPKTRLTPAGLGSNELFPSPKRGTIGLFQVSYGPAVTFTVLALLAVIEHGLLNGRIEWV